MAVSASMKPSVQLAIRKMDRSSMSRSVLLSEGNRHGTERVKRFSLNLRVVLAIW